MRPRVLCNLAASVDGKINPAHRRGAFTMSRHAEDPKRMRELRARADAVVIGATNLALDDPDLLPSRLRVVVTRSGDQVRPDAKMFDPALGGEGLVAHAATMTASKRASLAKKATLVELGPSEVDIARLLDWLEAQRRCRVVLCEGGGALMASFLAARAVDELHLTVVPRVLGGSNAPTVVEGSGFQPDAIPDPALVHVDRVGDELFLRYEFRWS